MPRTNNQILVIKATTGTPLDVDKEMTELVLDNVLDQNKAIDSCLSTALKSLLEQLVKKVVNSPGYIAQSTLLLIDNPKFHASAVHELKSE